MPFIWINSKRVDIDLKEELEEFDWQRAKWIDEKLICSSPFRSDSSPSFFVNLDDLPDKKIAGTWLDSGAPHNSEFRSGNFLQLLSYLREETEEETASYLLEKYEIKPYSNLKLKPSLKLKANYKPLQRPKWVHDTTYLPSRGIPAEICWEADVLTSDDLGTVAFLWKSPLGEIEAIKYRNTHKKFFHFEEGGKRINELLFGLDYICNMDCQTVAITEAEIDALSWRVIGFGAVATGSSNFSDAQASALIRSGARNIILSADNDNVGRALNNHIKRKLAPFFTLWEVTFPPEIKDVNDWIKKYGNKRPPIKKLERALK